MWGRIWSSARSSGGSYGGGVNPEHERRVRSDGARKQTNKGLQPPPRLLRRETEEYDRPHGRTPSSVADSSSTAGSSHAASSSSSGAELLPMKREWSEEPEEIELVAVKQEPEEIERQGVVWHEDIVADVDAVAAVIAERSLREEAERRRHDEELENLILKQAVATNLAVKNKDEWRRIREKQRQKFIDLVSSDEED